MKRTLPELLRHMRACMVEQEKLADSARHMKDKRFREGQAHAYRHIVEELEEVNGASNSKEAP